jgi:hypothetical protein
VYLTFLNDDLLPYEADTAIHAFHRAEAGKKERKEKKEGDTS